MGASVETITIAASEAGSFYHPFIKRTRGKDRLIDNPTGLLRALQDRIQDRLLRPLNFPAYLHGGVRGRSAVSNAAAHVGQKVVVTADIGDFFPSITNSQVFGAWHRTLGCSPRIAGLLTQLTSYCRRLPQGAPTSTSLANLILHEAGAEVRQLCRMLSVGHTAFVDDLTFSGSRAREVLNPAVKTLRDAGFRLPHRKIKVLGPRSRKAITGPVLGSKKLAVPKEKLSKARGALHHLSLSRPGSQEWEAAQRSAQGLIAYMSAIDKAMAERFRQELNGIQKAKSGRATKG